MPLKKAYKNVFDNRNSETLTGTVTSIGDSALDFVGKTPSRIVGSILGVDEKSPDKIGIDKNKIRYLVEASDNNEIRTVVRKIEEIIDGKRNKNNEGNSKNKGKFNIQGR